MRITNVTDPTLEIFRPTPEIDTGTCAIIAPGGGHHILAYDLEGTEVAQWLQSIGVTGIVLKYRVPGHAWDEQKKWLAAAQDGQRAVRLVRSRAAELGIDPNRVGVIGFSAGGAPVKYTGLIKKSMYNNIDKHDSVSFRPDFLGFIYTARLLENDEIESGGPPSFIAIAHDDKDRSIEAAMLYAKLKKLGMSAELHIYESGGHGYGLRETTLPVTSWHKRMEEWLRELNFLERPAK